jgi:hypothetical protein
MKRNRTTAIRSATTVLTQKTLLRHTGRSFLHRAFLAWREPVWRSRKAVQKTLNHILYRVSQRFWRAKIMRQFFDAWPVPLRLQQVQCPMCSLTEPPGLHRGYWQDPPRRRRWLTWGHQVLDGTAGDNNVAS